MISFISKPKLESLLDTEIILKMTKFPFIGGEIRGAVYTSDKKDYRFVFREDETNEIAITKLEEGDLIHLWANKYYLPHPRPKDDVKYSRETIDYYLKSIESKQKN